MNVLNWFGLGKAAAEPSAASPKASSVEAAPPDAPGPNDKEALTPEAAGIGMWWEMPENALERGFPDAVLHHEDAPKVWASVAMEHSEDGMIAEVGTFGAARADLQDSYATLDEGMKAAEGWALQEISREQSSHFVELSDGFLKGLSDMEARRGAEVERGPEMDSGLDR